MRFIVGDTETAGLGEEKLAVEIALIEIDEHCNYVREWYSLIDPQIPINPEATLIHGIKDADVYTAPTSQEFVATVLNGGLEDDICLISHNVSFDLELLACIGNITHTVCTLELSRAIIRGPENYKLQTLRQFFRIPEEKAHSAMGDTKVCLDLLRVLVRESGRSLTSHARTASRVVHTMPFGKHAGKPLLSLPVVYMDWLLALPDLEKNLRQSLITARAVKGQ